MSGSATLYLLFNLLKVHYATFYGPENKQRDRVLDTRNSLQELTRLLDVIA